MDDINEALTEAQDIHMFLKPLRIHFEEMEECDYPELEHRIPPMFHCVCLIWANCLSYQHPARIVVLLQEIANLIITLVSSTYVCSVKNCVNLIFFLLIFFQGHNYVTEEILKMEAEEGLEKIHDTLKICDLFVTSYFDHKNKMSYYFKEKTVLEWRFEPAMIFCNLNKFVNQLKIIQVS